MADRFPLILNTSTNQIQEIPSGDNLDLTGVGINNVGVITSGNVQIGAATTDLIVTGDARITGILTIGTDSITLYETANTINVGTALTLGHTQGLQFHTQNLHSAGFEVNQINVSGASTIGGNLDANGDLDVDGHTNLDNVNIVGVLTVTGAVNASHSTFGNLTALGLSLTNTNATINFNDTNNNPDYRVKADTGVFDVVQFNNGGSDINVVKVNTDGHIDIATNVDFAAGIDVTGNATVSGNLSVGGVLTYEDVTNVDSVGIVTAREGIQIPNDTYKLRSGAQLEMQVWHDGTNSIIKDTRDAGKVRIQADNFDIIDKDASTTVFSAAPGGINSPKLHTFSAGVNCTSTSAGAHQFATSGTPTTFAVTGQAEVTIGGGATKDNALAIESNTTAGLDYDSNIVLARSRGSHASKGIVQSGDFLGRVGFYGYDGSEYERAAEIAAVVSSGTGTNDMPTQLQFKTTPNGQNVPTTKLIVHHGGNIEIPNDYAELEFGNDQDLRIYHNGIQGKLDNHTGKFKIRSNAIKLSNLAENYVYIECAPSGNQDVQLFYNNNIKFQTTSSGVSVTGNITGTGDLTLTSTDSGAAAAPIIDLVRNSSSAADNDLLGQLRFSGKDDQGSAETYAYITGKILDASAGGEDGILEFTHRKNSAFVITGRWRSDSLQLLNGTNFSVDVTSDFTVDATFFGGAGAVEIAANSDIRLTNGNWTGDHNAKIQHHNNSLYLQGGSGAANNKSIILRGSTTDRWYVRHDGHFYPNVDSTYDIGSSSVRVRNGYFDTLYGDGSNLTNITSTTINSNANNRVITGSGTANTLNGESQLT